MRSKVALAFLCVAACAAHGAGSIGRIDCEGVHGRHLQGVASDGRSIWWCFTVDLVKTDLSGRILASVKVPKHHGDICLFDGLVYAAVNLGRFNQEAGQAVSKVMAYDADTLAPRGTWDVPEVVHGAGGMTFADGRFFIVGGLPSTHERNYVYEYTKDFRFVKRHELATGNTFLGVQTATFEDGELLLGVYGWKGNPPGTLHCDKSLTTFRRTTANTSTGLVKIGGRYYAAGTSCDEMGNNACGWLTRLDEWPAPEYSPPRNGGKVIVVRGAGVKVEGRAVVDCGYRRGADHYRPLYVIDEPYTPRGLFPTGDVVKAICVGGRFDSDSADLIRAVRRAASEDETVVFMAEGPDCAVEVLKAAEREARRLNVEVERISLFDPPRILGRDYWTLLSSGPYSDPAKSRDLPAAYDNPDVANRAVFRDCGLVNFSHGRPPPVQSGRATWRTVRENYAPDGRDWSAVEANAKPDKPLVAVFTPKRHILSMAGKVDLDYEDYAAWKARHPNLVSIRTMCEWGNDIMLTLKGIAGVKDAARRAELERLWGGAQMDDRRARLDLAKRFFDWKDKISYRDHELLSAFRSIYSLDHLAADLGARRLTLETTDTTGIPGVEFRWDVMSFFVRGAARQYGVPWAWYCAIYRNGYTRDGIWVANSTCKHMNCGLNGQPLGGVSPSLERRAWYYAYLNGANAVEPEGWSNHFLVTNSVTGRIEFSDRGRMFADFHDFTVRNPGRGRVHAPVAILLPADRGYMAYGGKAWGKCEYGPGDYATDAVLYSIVPGFDRAAHLRNGGEGNLHNSRFAMMYDVLVPDLSQDREEFSRVLRMYPAAILVGDYSDPSVFSGVLDGYVRDGGELIRVDPSDLPAPGKDAFANIAAGRLRFPSVEAVLERLQERHFPFRVRGDMQYGANRTQRGWWLWCLNNRGVTKFVGEEAFTDESCCAAVSVEIKDAVPAIHVRELVTRQEVRVEGGAFSFDIPAGGVAVFEIAE